MENLFHVHHHQGGAPGHCYGHQYDAFSLHSPAAPHFRGVWERQISSIRFALCAILGAPPVPKKVILNLNFHLERKRTVQCLTKELVTLVDFLPIISLETPKESY